MHDLFTVLFVVGAGFFCLVLFVAICVTFDKIFDITIFK